MKQTQTYDDLLRDLEDLKAQLQEANETIHAIRTGQVDALIVQGENGSQLYTLKSADHTYRVFIEKMKEGAVTLNNDGMILYSNSQFADMVNLPWEKVVGLPIADLIPDEWKSTFRKITGRGQINPPWIRRICVRLCDLIRSPGHQSNFNAAFTDHQIQGFASWHQ